LGCFQRGNKVGKRQRAMSFIGTMLIVITLLVMMIPSWRSHILMRAITEYESAKVVGKAEGITLEFASSHVRDFEELKWSSPMILFNKFGMPIERLGFDGEETVDLSIYYTFGAFENGSSLIYKEDSPYNSAFYGAYVIRLDDSKGTVDLMKLTAAITRYDYHVLILYQLGLDINEADFTADVADVQKSVTRFGSDDWLQVDAMIETRSVSHVSSGFRQHYLQFGWPLQNQLLVDFPEVTLYGRTYTKYYAEEGVYVIFYVQAATPELMDFTDQELLSKSKIIMEW